MKHEGNNYNRKKEKKHFIANNSSDYRAPTVIIIFKGKVIGFFDSWAVDRKFPIDMAGFAVSVEFLNRSPNANMPYKVGYEEDIFLKSLGLGIEDIEPLASNCTKVRIIKRNNFLFFF